MPVSESLSALRSDLTSVGNDISMLTSELASVASNGTGEAKARLLERISVLQEKSSALQRSIKYAIGDTTDAIDTGIKENPYKAMAAAGLVGAAIGYLLSTKK